MRNCCDESKFNLRILSCLLWYVLLGYLWLLVSFVNTTPTHWYNFLFKGYVEIVVVSYSLFSTKFKSIIVYWHKVGDTVKKSSKYLYTYNILDKFCHNFLVSVLNMITFSRKGYNWLHIAVLLSLLIKIAIQSGNKFV